MSKTCNNKISLLSQCITSFGTATTKDMSVNTIKLSASWWQCLLLLVWQAPLWMHSAKRRYQSSEWTILSHSYRLIQWEIVWSQVLLDSLHPCSSRTVDLVVSSSSPKGKQLWYSWHLSHLAFLQCPNRDRRRAWTIADRCGCPVVHLTSSFCTWWYHLIPNNFHKHHWSRASILSTSLLVTAQHSEPYRKIGRIQVCYTGFIANWKDKIQGLFKDFSRT